jgi:hypothetical protein
LPSLDAPPQAGAAQRSDTAADLWARRHAQLLSNAGTPRQQVSRSAFASGARASPSADLEAGTMQGAAAPTAMPPAAAAAKGGGMLKRLSSLVWNWHGLNEQPQGRQTSGPPSSRQMSLSTTERDNLAERDEPPSAGAARELTDIHAELDP